MASSLHPCAAASHLHASFHRPVDVGKSGMIVQTCTNSLKRWFIPGFASSQDKKVSAYFIGFFSFLLNSKDPLEIDRVTTMISLAEQQMHRREKQPLFGKANAEMSRLNHYIMVVRRRFNLFNSSESEQAFVQKCRSDNKGLLFRWKKAGFPEEAFWDYPDLVDFIFQTHLHRIIPHPYYRHTLSMHSRIVHLAGQTRVIREPHLMCNGRYRPWSEICRNIHVDSESQLYSRKNGIKRRWVYLEHGLTALNENHVAFPQPLRKLDRPPPHCQVQIVTTHAHPEDRKLVDRVLEGTRHSFLRVILGEGFSFRHPETQWKEGMVYSFGWGTIWRHFNILSPLSTLKGRWYSPDEWEFLKQDHCVTTLDVTDEQLIRLMGILRQHNQKGMPFHFITANCSGVTTQLLNEAGILDLTTKNHMARLGYEFFIPKRIRVPLDKVILCVHRSTPKCISKAFYYIGTFFYSLIFAPLFTVLGGWRARVFFEDEEENSSNNPSRAKASSRGVQALFSGVLDIFNPKKMEFDMTKNVYKWQQTQANTIFEKRD